MTVQADPSASFRLLKEALEVRGFSMETLAEEPMVVAFKDSAGHSWTTRAAKIAYPFNSDDVRALSINKDRAYEFAAAHGFPVPHSRVVEAGEVFSESECNELIATYGKLIVKPADSSLGRGLTLNITNYAQLVAAIAKAREVSARVLVQQQVEGQEIRFVVVAGKVGAALLRQTARVIGDGVSTIAELIAKENETRIGLKFPYISYPQLDTALVGDAMTSTRVPTQDEVVELNKSTMIRGGASIYNVLPEIDESYVRQVESLVQKTGAGFIVADVFCQDHTAAATDSNHQLIEFNTAPVLKLCYACRDGRNYDVVSQLADAIVAHVTEVKD